MYNLNKIIDQANQLGVEVFLVPVENEAIKSKQGIHLLMPSLHEIEDAFCVAERDGFKTIYIHNQF